MKLTVYKGFDINFLKKLEEEPLVDNEIEEKLNVLKFDKKTRKKLDMSLLSLEDNDNVWATYEEYTLIKNRVDDAVREDGLQLVVLRNNLYPDYYPLLFDISSELVSEIERHINSDFADDGSEECQRFLAIYNSLVEVEGTFFGSFYNFEYDRDENIDSRSFYPSKILIEEGMVTGEYDVFINEDVDTYLRDLARIKILKPRIIGMKSTNGLVSKRIQESLQAFCVAEKIRIVM